MGDLSKNFSLSEFKSPRDKWKAKVDKPTDRLIKLLETLREFINEPVHIESGIRSAQYNASLPGSGSNSGHLTGEAADIWVKGLSNKKLGQIIRDLYHAGRLPELTYTYLIRGSSNTRAHVGVDKKNRRSIWGSGYADIKPSA